MSTHACIRCSAKMPVCRHDFRPYRADVHWCCKCGALRVPERSEPFMPMSYVWCPSCADLPNFVSSEAGNPLINPLVEGVLPTLRPDPDDVWMVRAAAARASGREVPPLRLLMVQSQPRTRTCNVCAYRSERGAGRDGNLCPLLGCPGELQDG